MVRLLQHESTHPPADAGHETPWLMMGVAAFFAVLALFALFRYVIPEWRRRRRGNH